MVPRHLSFLLEIKITIISPSPSLFLSLSLSLSPSLPPSLFLFISLTDEEGVCTLFTGQREREREGAREKEGERVVCTRSSFSELHAKAESADMLTVQLVSQYM